MKNMEFFLLNEECYFIKGAKNGTIYNSHNNNIAVLDESLTKTIDDLEKKIPLSKINPGINVMNSLNKLFMQGFGRVFDNFHRLEKKKDNVKRYMINSYPIVRRLFLNITSECNYDCTFCNKRTYKVNHLTGCNRWPNASNNISLEGWLSIIKDVRMFDCESLQIIGGEPLLRKHETMEIIKYAKSIGYKNIILFTNGSILDDEILMNFTQNDVTVIMQLVNEKGLQYDAVVKSDNVIWPHKSKTFFMQL